MMTTKEDCIAFFVSGGLTPEQAEIAAADICSPDGKGPDHYMIGHAKAIRDRRDYLESRGPVQSRQAKKVGLVHLRTAIYRLASRYVDPPEWPGHEVSEQTKIQWEIQWYVDYTDAIAELAASIKAALLDKKLTPRGLLTGAPQSPETTLQWIDKELPVLRETTMASFWGKTWKEWPDDALTPDIWLAQKELFEWENQTTPVIAKETPEERGERILKAVLLARSTKRKMKDFYEELARAEGCGVDNIKRIYKDAEARRKKA